MREHNLVNTVDVSIPQFSPYKNTFEGKCIVLVEFGFAIWVLSHYFFHLWSEIFAQYSLSIVPPLYR